MIFPWFWGNVDANNDAASTAYNTAVRINVLANDSNTTGSPLRVVRTDSVDNGHVTINGDGTLTFTPRAGFSGTETFSYKIEGGSFKYDEAHVTVTVAPPNRAPIANANHADTHEDTAVTIAVLSNDSDPDGNPLTITGVSGVDNGTVVINANGTLTFTPRANYNGTESFTYTITDGKGGHATAAVDVRVAPVNDAPVANANHADTQEDTAVTIAVLANDTDVDGDALTVTGVSGVDNGTVVINPNGTLTFTPAANYNGTEQFTYTVSDGRGGTASASVDVRVAPVNDNPIARDDAATTAEDTAVTIAVLANDSDAEGSPLTVRRLEGVENGTATINANGTITFVPAANFVGTETFVYVLTDGRNDGPVDWPTWDYADVVVTVTGVNDAPVAGNNHADTQEDTAVTIAVLANDTDIDGDTLTVTGVAGVDNGTVVINPNGTLTFTPAANYNGTETFTYTITDGRGGHATGTVDVRVVPVNDAPVAAPNLGTTNEDTAVTIAVLGNDTDVDGDTLTVTGVSGVDNGTVVINPNGTLIFTPAANFNGTETFSYTISDGQGGTATSTAEVRVSPVNDAPVANDDTASAVEDAPVTVAVLGNDTDPDGNPLTVTGIVGVDNGTVVINPNGTLTFTPAANFNGTETFSYTVSDGQGGIDTADVTVTVGAVNDAPNANDDTATTNRAQPVIIAVLGNDTDIDGNPLTVTGTAGVDNGTVVINPNGTLTFTSAAGFSGTEVFTYTISDGQGGTDTASVTVGVINTQVAPDAVDDRTITNEDTAVRIAVLGNDTDANGDPLTVTGVAGVDNGTVMINADGTLTFTPKKDFNGSETFSYTIGDGQGGTDRADVTVTVLPVNDAPVARDDSARVREGEAVTLRVLRNDRDVDGDTLTVVDVTGEDNGTVTINADGTVTYTANAGFVGDEILEYTISDGNGGFDNAHIKIIVAARNVAPVANTDTVTTREETAVTINVLGNDTDANGDPLSIARLSGVGNGTATINPNGTISFVPEENFVGTEVFFYDVTDGKGGTARAKVFVNVTNTNDAPVATDDEYAATTGQPLRVSARNGLLANDSDVDADALSIIAFTQPEDLNGDAAGSISVNADGSFTFTGTEAGWINLSYTATDGNGGTVTADAVFLVTDLSPIA